MEDARTPLDGSGRSIWKGFESFYQGFNNSTSSSPESSLPSANFPSNDSDVTPKSHFVEKMNEMSIKDSASSS